MMWNTPHTHTHIHGQDTGRAAGSAGLPRLPSATVLRGENNHRLLRKGEKSQGHWLLSCSVKGLCRDLNPGSHARAHSTVHTHKIQTCVHTRDRHKHRLLQRNFRLSSRSSRWRQNHNKASHMNLSGFPVCSKSCIYTILSSSKCVALCPKSHARALI